MHLPIPRKTKSKLFQHRNDVNIFSNRLNRVTFYISTLCNTHCLALQKRLFCTPKVPILQRKTGTIATPNSLLSDLACTFFTNQIPSLHPPHKFFRLTERGKIDIVWRKTYVINRLFCRIVLVFWNSKNHAIDTCAIGFYKLKRCEMRFH